MNKYKERLSYFKNEVCNLYSDLGFGYDEIEVTNLCEGLLSKIYEHCAIQMNSDIKFKKLVEACLYEIEMQLSGMDEEEDDIDNIFTRKIKRYLGIALPMQNRYAYSFIENLFFLTLGVDNYKDIEVTLDNLRTLDECCKLYIS